MQSICKHSAINKKIYITVLYLLLLQFVATAKDFSQSEDSLVSYFKYVKELAGEKPDSAKKIVEESLSHSQHYSSLVNAHLQNALAEACFELSEFDLAEQAYKKAISGFKNNSDTTLWVNSLNNLGVLCYLTAEFDRALFYYDQVLELEVKRKDSLGVAEIYQNIGLVYEGLEHFEPFFEFSLKALEVYERIGMDDHVADIANNLGMVYAVQDKYADSFMNLDKAERLFRKQDDTVGFCVALSNKGFLFRKQKKYEAALVSLNEAIELLLKYESPSELIDAYSNVADVYKEIGEKTKAITYYRLAQVLREKIGVVDIHVDNHYDMYETYKAMGDYKNALAMLELANVRRDSLFTAEKYKIVAEAENKYYSEKREKELLNLRMREQKKSKYIILLLMLIAIVIASLVVIVYVLKIKERSRRLVLEQKILRIQMNPHFIFNSLSGVQSLILQERTIDACDYVGYFSKLLRLILEHGNADVITLKLELEILHNYLFIQNMRFEHPINYQINIDERLDEEHTMVPPLLAQPFIENAIEHGGLSKIKDNLIQVNYTLDKSNILLVVEDNGVGINKTMGKQKKKGHKSLAVDITRSRIKSLMGSESNDFFSIEDLSIVDKQGTRVKCLIPYVNK